MASKKYKETAEDTATVSYRVRRVIAEEMGHGVDEVTPDSTLVNDLGMDSLDLVELSLALEEEFKVDLNDDEAEEVFDPSGGHAHGEGTVKAVIALVESRTED